MYKLKSIDSWIIKDRGRVFGVENPKETMDFAYLIGKKVQIDGKIYEVAGVERFMHSPPWRKGAPIGILIK